MEDIRNWKMPQADKEVVDDENSKSKIIKDIFKEQKDKEAVKRIFDQKNLNLFGDKDNDKILNVFDKNPLKKDKINIKNKIW